MTDILMVICGKMTIYYPKDKIEPLWSHLYELRCFKTGSVLVECSGTNETLTTIEPDSPALAKALSEIEALLAEHPECPIEKRPFFNEIFMHDGTYRYAPRAALETILSELYTEAHTTPPLNYAGAVVNDTPSEE